MKKSAEVFLKKKGSVSKNKKPDGKYKYMKRDVKENIEYFLLMSIPLLLLIVFKFLPAYGMLLAFQDYVPGMPIFGENTEWVGLKWIRQVIRDPYIWRGIVNNLRLFALGTLFMFAPVGFAILTAEIRNKKAQGFTRVFCYMPNFLSEVVVCGFALGMLSSTGVITQMINTLGGNVNNLTTSSTAFPWVYCIINCWQSFGWGSLLYTAAIAGIDPGLYEAAKIDGANKLQQIWHVTMSSLKPMIIYSFIMRFSGMLGSDVTQIIRMYNPSVYNVADTIGSYLYRDTLLGGRYSFGSAAGLLIAVINFIAMYICNKICQKVGEFSMW